MIEHTSERRCFYHGKKGQKFIKFTDEERIEIVGKYLSGKYRYKSLANEYGISWKTVESMVRNWYYYFWAKGSTKGKRFNQRRLQGKIWDIKKIPSLPQGTTREKVTFINLYRDNYKLYNMCAVLEIRKILIIMIIW